MTSPISASPGSSLQQTGEVLKSSPFSGGANDKMTWRLDLYPKGKNQMSEDYLAIDLGLVSCDKLEVRAKDRLSILNGKGEEKHFTESSQAYRYVPVRARVIRFFC